MKTAPSPVCGEQSHRVGRMWGTARVLPPVVLLWLMLGSDVWRCVQAAAWHVPGDFSTIQGALDATNSAGAYRVRSGDSIAVGPGVHRRFYVKSTPERTLSQISFFSLAGPDDTVIDGNGYDGIWLDAPRCSVEGFTVVNADTGLALRGEDCTATRMRIVKCGQGASLGSGIQDGSGERLLTSSLICSNSNQGLRVYGNASLRELFVHNNRFGGIAVHRLGPPAGEEVFLTGSVICSNGSFGVHVEPGVPKLTMHGNLVYRNATGLSGSPEQGWIYNNAFSRHGLAVSAPSSGCRFSIEPEEGTNIIGGPVLGGNYYDDYYGRDLDGDRLGDTRLPHYADAHPLVPDPPHRAELGITEFKVVNLIRGNEVHVSARLTVTNAADYAIADVPVVLQAQDFVLATRLLGIGAYSVETWELSWDPVPWLATMTNLVAAPTGGRLVAATNLTIQALVDPGQTISESDRGDNVSEKKTLEYVILPDLAIRHVRMLQVNEHECMIKDRPMMVQATVALDSLRPDTMLQAGMGGAVEVYPGQDLVKSNLFAEIQRVDFRLRFDDGNPTFQLLNYHLFPAGEALYAVPAKQAAAFRQIVRSRPDLVDEWRYRFGVDRLNFTAASSRDAPRPRGSPGSVLTASVELVTDDGFWQNDKTNATARVVQTSPVYRVLFKALDSWGTDHRKSIREHRRLMKQHCDFLEAAFPVVKVEAFYDDDNPSDDSKPPEDPETVYSFYAKMPTLSHKAGAWRQVANGGFLSTVYILPSFALGIGIAGASYPHLGWGVFVDEYYVNQIHVTAHEIFHSWQGYTLEGYDKSRNLHWLSLAGEGWDVRGKLEAYLSGTGPARVNLTADLASSGRTWQTHMGNHNVPRPWITDENWQFAFRKMILEGGVPLGPGRGGIALSGGPPSRLLRVAGEIDPERGLTLYPFYESSGEDTEPTNGTFCVECRDSAGALLRPAVCFEPGPAVIEMAEDPGSGRFFGFTLECPEGTARLVFEEQAVTLGEFVFSKHTPDLADVAVSPRGDGPWGVSWTASDADGDALEFDLYYSADGNNWFPLRGEIAAKPPAFSSTFQPQSKPGGTACRIAVVASDGVNSRRIESDPFVVPRKQPVAALLAPAAGARFLEGEEVLFDGYGYDTDDGLLSGETFVWSSDRDGELGRGTDCLRHSGLSSGRHTVTLTVVDSDANRARAHAEIEIGTLRVDPAEFLIGPARLSTNIVLLTGRADQAWTVSADVPWIRIGDPLTGQGSATVSFEVANHFRVDPRVGHLLVGGVSVPVTQSGPADLNGNGADDAWEAEHGLTEVTEWSDVDGDGWKDLWESWAGTDPRDPQARFGISGLSYDAPAPGQITLFWPSAPDRFYTVWRATALPGPFTSLGRHLPATPPGNRFVDTNQTAVRFYLLELE